VGPVDGLGGCIRIVEGGAWSTAPRASASGPAQAAVARIEIPSRQAGWFRSGAGC
jgi:hypothetical protein